MKGLSGGPASMLSGYVLFGFAPVFVRLARDYGWLVTHTLVARFGFALAGVAALTWLARRRGQAWGFDPHNRRLLFLRGLFGGAAVLCYFTAIQYLGAGRGTLLNYTHSIFANLFGFLILGHRPRAAYWPCLAAALCGLWLVVDPRFDGFSWPEALGLLSGVLGGAAIVTIKQLRQTDNAVTIFSSLTVGGLFFALPALAMEGSSLWQADTARAMPAGWAALLALAILSMTGQLLFTHGYRHTSVALGTVLSLTTPLLAALAGWLFLHEALSAHVILGGVLILSASLATSLLERSKKDAWNE